MKTMIYKSLSTLFVLIFLNGMLYSQKIQDKQSKQNQVLSVQCGKQAVDFPNNVLLNSPYKKPLNQKAYTSLLTQDFSSATFPPTGWTSTIISGTLNWARGTNLTLSYNSLNGTGTTFSDGYAIVDSDVNGGAGGAENCVLTSQAINCTGQSYVWLKFNEFFRQFGASTGHVEVSNNGSTWTTVYSAETGLAANESTANPHFVDVDVSAYAANQATFYVRFHWTGNYDYYWIVDDIDVYIRPQYDAAFSGRTNMNAYSIIPWKHYTTGPLTQSATAFNTGGATMTTVYMTNTVYDGDTWSVLQTNSSNYVPSITANSTSLLTAPSYTPPAGNGFYVSENIIHIAEADADINNDTISQGFWINDSIFARDDAMFTGFLDGSLGSNSSEIILGNIFTFTSSDALTHVRAWVTGPQVGNQAQIVVYNFAGGVPTTLLTSSNIFTFTTAGGQWLDLPMSTGAVTLNPGTYFFGVKQITTTVNLGIAYTDNNFTPLTTFVKIGTDPFDTLSNYGYDVSFIIHPIVVCGAYHPVITSSYSHICTGDQVTLTSSPGTSYLWSPGNQTTVSINVTTAGTYSVQTTSNIGCTAVSNPLTLSEYPKPTISLGTDITVCDEVQLDAGPGFVSYQWTGGGTTQYLDVTSTGNYVVTVTDTYCSNTDDINVIVNASPVPVITGGGSFCYDATVSLNAGSGYDSYLWSVGTSTSELLNVDTMLVDTGTTTIYVTVTQNGCTGIDSVDVTFHSCVDISEVAGINEMSIFPNPNNGNFAINTSGFEGEFNLTITNNIGEIVYTQRFDNYNNEIVPLNIKGVPYGIYYIQVNNDEISRVLKIVVK
ncbi:MAG: T9SS type A sorting domain-containing protein [Bacteroidota bacterium]